ncbi:MAG: pyridoxamine 5'-phosphate oxidase family protein [Bauldia sp.]|nr:pyridoxamine 5'-phosphate oxidase family protein [Bauldia sp.]
MANDRAKIKELWTPFARAWWESADDPDIRVLTVTPSKSEIWEGAQQARRRRIHADGGRHRRQATRGRPCQGPPLAGAVRPKLIGDRFMARRSPGPGRAGRAVRRCAAAAGPARCCP